MNIDLNPQFKKIIYLMEETNQNLFITGKAGTGKSTLLDYFCRNANKKPVVLASTGIAALNVKGQTIHRFFNFYIDVTPDKIQSKAIKPHNPKLYRKLKTIIIDEVSMLRADLLDCVDIFLQMYGPDSSQAFGGVQMIFVGDLYQLPPVVSRKETAIFHTYYDSPYFFSAKALESTTLKVMELEKIYRQKDEQFVNLLSKIRNNSVEFEDMDELNQRYYSDRHSLKEEDFTIHLTTTNAKADEINEKHVTNLSGQLYSSVAKVQGDFGKEYYPTLMRLQFKAGSQIMLLNNDPKKRWVNGSIGIIESVEHDKNKDEYLNVRLQKTDQLVEISPFVWEVYKFLVKKDVIVSESVGSFTQYPFRLAWAVTIHKSQGKTFDRVIVDIGFGAFASGQVYVALSRCTSFEGIQLTAPIKKQHILIDSRIYKFLTFHAYKKAMEKLPVTERVKIVEQAIQSQQPLMMKYLQANDTKFNQLIIPLTVGEEDYQGKKFLGMLAYCIHKNEQRMFNLARVLDLNLDIGH